MARPDLPARMARPELWGQPDPPGLQAPPDPQGRSERRGRLDLRDLPEPRRWVAQPT